MAQRSVVQIHRCDTGKVDTRTENGRDRPFLVAPASIPANNPVQVHSLFPRRSCLRHWPLLVPPPPFYCSVSSPRRLFFRLGFLLLAPSLSFSLSAVDGSSPLLSSQVLSLFVADAPVSSIFNINQSSCSCF
ncbi:hypothetical protein C4D60_Mb06t08350 [Musa balbisiana]|uniref:Uncharacterized protein n=1 Tax=Musa balbisiana TaxID=52838 RepID=A0A4S8INZ5_MUSBA|nr:hypothetical protein C4D60_Mb06t08350 [Musa balbisiana]